MVDGVEHDGAGGEDEGELVVEAHDEHPEEEPDHQRGDGRHDGREPGARAVAGAELVRHTHPATIEIKPPNPNVSTVLF